MIILVTREKWIQGGLASAGAAISYSTGFLLAPITAVWLVLFHGNALVRQRRLLLLMPPACASLGLLLVFLIQDYSTGVRGSFLKVQGSMGFVKYDDPLEVLQKTALRPLSRPTNIRQEWKRETFALRASNGKLVGIQFENGKRELIARFVWYQAPNAFGITQLPDGKISLYTKRHHILRAFPDRQHPILEYWLAIGPDASFTEINLGEDKVAFQTSHGTYLGTSDSRRIQATATTIGETETFTKEGSRDLFARYPLRKAAMAAQTVLVCLSGLTALVLLAVGRARPLSLHVLISLHFLFYLVFSLAAGVHLNHVRAEAFLLPVVITLRHAGVLIQLLFAIAYVAVSFPVAVLFFQKVIT
jgi:hypothetical protein